MHAVGRGGSYSSDALLPFTISVPDSELVDLRERLAKARWAAEPIGGAKGYGGFPNLGEGAPRVLA
jgi:hypothetical protein